jgi:hypothetical protein
MTETFDDAIHRVLRLTREMLALADEGDLERHDDAGAVLFGVLRDSAWRLRRLAEEAAAQQRRSDPGDGGMGREP